MNMSVLTDDGQAVKKHDGRIILMNEVAPNSINNMDTLWHKDIFITQHQHQERNTFEKTKWRLVSTV